MLCFDKCFSKCLKMFFFSSIFVVFQKIMIIARNLLFFKLLFVKVLTSGKIYPASNFAWLILKNS